MSARKVVLPDYNAALDYVLGTGQDEVISIEVVTPPLVMAFPSILDHAAMEYLDFDDISRSSDTSWGNLKRRLDFDMELPSTPPPMEWIGIPKRKKLMAHPNYVWPTTFTDPALKVPASASVGIQVDLYRAANTSEIRDRLQLKSDISMVASHVKDLDDDLKNLTTMVNAKFQRLYEANVDVRRSCAQINERAKKVVFQKQVNKEFTTEAEF